MQDRPEGTEIVSQDARSVRLRMTNWLWSVFVQHRISFGGRSAANMPFVELHKTARIEAYADFTNGTLLHSLGAFSYSRSGGVVFDAGRYCSIADRTTVMGERHPIEHVTTSNFPYQTTRPSFRWAREDLLDGNANTIQPTIRNKPRPVLQHDVWTGNDVIIGRGITLHTGSVIGAGAVVTKDVPAYAIVGGSPARVIRKRFADRTIERLLESRWWERHPGVLFDHDITDPDRFLDQLAEAPPRPAFTPAVLGWPELRAMLKG